MVVSSIKLYIILQKIWSAH